MVSIVGRTPGDGLRDTVSPIDASPRQTPYRRTYRAMQGTGARCSASWVPSLLSHFDTRSRSLRDVRVVPCPSSTGDIPSSRLRRQNILFEILHLVLQLVEVVRQFLLRQRKHLGFFFFHMMFDVLHKRAELRVKIMVIWPHLPQRRNQVLDL